MYEKFNTFTDLKDDDTISDQVLFLVTFDYEVNRKKKTENHKRNNNIEQNRKKGIFNFLKADGIYLKKNYLVLCRILNISTMK